MKIATGTYFGMVGTHASQAYTALALTSFLKHTQLSNGDRFFLIDNDYTMDLPDTSSVILVRNPAPLSFATNVNKILRMAQEDKKNLLFVNNDIIFTPDWASPLVSSTGAILVPACNHSYMQYRDWRLGPMMDLDDYRGHEHDLENLSRLIRADARFKGRVVTRLHVGFYAFFLPLDISKIVGLFDERFGLGGGEDVDYRIRANLAGFDVKITLDSFLLHFTGKSTWRGAETPAETRIRDDRYRKYFIAKWGQDLAEIFLFSSRAQQHVEHMGLNDLLERGDYSSLIRACIERSGGNLPCEAEKLT